MLSLKSMDSRVGRDITLPEFVVVFTWVAFKGSTNRIPPLFGVIRPPCATIRSLAEINSVSDYLRIIHTNLDRSG